MDIPFGPIMQFLWIGFIVYWIVAARSVNKMLRREPAWHRWLQLLVAVVAVYLFNSNASWWGVLNRRFAPWSLWAADAYVLLTAAGIGFAIWARNHIGRFWSGSVALREDHQLIRTGPYARIRHPIYTGILFALAATALLAGTYKAALAFFLVLVALSFKARREEALLAGEFGAQFDEHRRRTGFFLPRLS